MKKILTAAVLIATFLIMPSVSSAQKVAIADNDLNSISAQYGSVTVTYDDSIAIQANNNLATTAVNFSDFWGNKITTNAYFGMTDYYVTDAVFYRHGSITLSVTTLPVTDPLYPTTMYKQNVTIDNLTVSSSDVGIGMTVKLGTRSDLTTWSGGVQQKDQVLGQIYIGGISATVNGSLSVYASTRTWNP